MIRLYDAYPVHSKYILIKVASGTRVSSHVIDHRGSRLERQQKHLSLGSDTGMVKGFSFSMYI